MRNYITRSFVPINRPLLAAAVGSLLKRTRHTKGAGALLLLALLIPASTFAATLNYTGATTGTIDTPTNWSTGTTPSGSGSDALTFNESVSGPLSLSYLGNTTTAANPGVSVVLTSAQTDSVTINLNNNSANNFRFNGSGIQIASGAGAFTLTSSGTTSFTIFNGVIGFINNSSNPATISSSLFFNDTSAGVATPVFGGSGNWSVNTNLSALNQAGNNVQKIGTGTLNLTAANTYTGITTVTQGILNLTGSITATSQIIIGNSNAIAGAFYQNPGTTVTQTSSAGGAFQLGSVVGGQGYYNLAGGTLTSGGEIDPGGSGGGAGTFGQFDMTSGTINMPNNASSYFLPNRGAAGETSVTNILGGTVQIAGGGTPADSNINGLSMNWSASGAAQTATVTIGGSGSFLTPSLRVKMNQGASFNGVGGNSANVANLNLNSGGLLQTLGFENGTTNNPNDYINFNGGTLKAGTAANTTFLFNIGGVEVYSNGGTIDNNGQNITIGQGMVAVTGSGVSSVGVTAGGSGYFVPPSVTFTGGGGVGATGYATINTAGVVTGIVITNPGTGYTSAPTVALTGGGGTGATVGGAAMLSNTSGGMTFQGAGTTTLTGQSTYTGTTNILAGTVVLSSTATLGGTQRININGSNVKFLQTSTIANTAPINLTQGTLAGTGTVGAVTVGAGTGGIIQNGNGTAASLTVGSITFLGGAAVNILDSNTLGAAPINNKGGLVTSAAGAGEIVISGSGTWANGVNPLITYTTLTGSISDFALASGTVGGLTGRQTSASLVNTGSSIALNVVGDSLVWTGATTSGTGWVTVPTGSATSATPSWVLKAGHTTTDYWAGDIVEFDDSANLNGSFVTPSTTVTISGSNVAPASITFNNNALAYTVNSSDGHGIIGATGILMTGTGAVTLSESNSYTGATAVNNGTLNLVGGSLAGTAITVGTGGTLNEDAASSIGGAASLTTSGVATINGSNSYTGATSVNGGSLALNGTLNGTAVTVSGSTAFNESATGALAGASSLTNSGNTTLAGNNTNTGVITNNAGATALTGTLNGASVTVNAGTFTESTAGAINGAGALTSNAGLTTINGVNTFTGGVTLASGTFNLTSTGVLGSSTINISPISGGVAVFNSAGNMNLATKGINVGTVLGDVGVLNITAGVINGGASGGSPINAGTGGLGVINMTGGTVIPAQFLVAGITGAGAMGVWNFSGGSVQTTGNNGGTLGATAGTAGVLNITGTGSYVSTDTTANGVSGIYVGESGTGTLNVSGNGVASLGGVSTSNGLDIGRNNVTTAVGEVNLGAVGTGGGTINTVRIQKTGAAATAIFDFHGGTLKASTGANSTFFTGLTSAYVYGEGGTIDNNSQNITIGQALLAPTGNGVTSIALTGTTGFTPGATPFVTISGGGGTGATAITNVDGNGNLSVVITNPGTGYTSAPTVTLTGNTGSSTATASIGADVGGGLTFQGTGTTTLSASNTYSGATSINSGHLLVSGMITGSTVNVAAGATLSSGTVGTVSTIAPTNATSSAVVISGTLSPGEVGTIAPITFALQTGAKLNFQAGSSLLLDTGTTSQSDSVIFASAGDWLTGSGHVALVLNGTVDYTSTYVVFQNVTTTGFTVASITGYDSTDFTAQFTQVGTNYDLTFAAVPEPGTYAMALGGLAILGCWQRTRRRGRSIG